MNSAATLGTVPLVPFAAPVSLCRPGAPSSLDPQLRAARHVRQGYVTPACY